MRKQRMVGVAAVLWLSSCASLPPVPAVTQGVIVASCAAAGEDTDQDGLSDVCERSLAQVFAPVFSVSANACNLIATERGSKLGGGYLHAVQPRAAGARIAYLPAYFNDCGWSGAKCRVPFIDCAPHAGDSELVVLDVRRSGDGSWSVDGVFLSAHCFGVVRADCRWYRGSEIAAFEWRRDNTAVSPVIWVADGRNANYPSQRACERGHWFIDTCAAPRVEFRFQVSDVLNLGSRAVPLVYGRAPPGCVFAATVDPHAQYTVPGSLECFWLRNGRFRGWQASGNGTTAYEQYLRVLGEF